MMIDHNDVVDGIVPYERLFYCSTVKFARRHL